MMVQPHTGCAGAGSYISTAQMTVTKACELLTPHLEAAERAVGCVPELPAVALLGSWPSLWAQKLSLPLFRHRIEVNTLGWEKPERSAPVSSLGEGRSAPSG